jgi:uncharacterized membrane protein YfcA
MEPWLLLGVAMLATGVVAGVLAGLFGIGGGIVIVPVLETALGFVGVDPAIRMHIAVGTSLATIVPTSISSARAHRKRDAVDVDLVKRWGVFVLVGSLLGAWVASQVHSDVLAVVFATLAMLMAVKKVFFPDSRNLTDSIPRGPLVPGLLTIIGLFSSMMGIGGGLFTVMTLTLFNVSIHRAVGTAALFGRCLASSLPCPGCSVSSPPDGATRVFRRGAWALSACSGSRASRRSPCWPHRWGRRSPTPCRRGISTWLSGHSS